MIPPTLKTKNFILKPYSRENEDVFVEMGMDEISVQFMGGAMGIEAEERKLFRKIFEIYERNDQRWFWLWGIFRGDKLCGHLEIKETENTKEGELEIVYMIHPKERRKGIMSEILAFLKQKQKDWDRRIIATVSPENVNSIALLQKWGVDEQEILFDKETGKEYLKLILAE